MISQKGNRLILEEQKTQQVDRKDALNVKLLKLLDRSSSEFEDIMESLLERRQNSHCEWNRLQAAHLKISREVWDIKMMLL